MRADHPLREPMVWLVAGIPAVSVVAGIGLVVIAAMNRRDDQVIDRVQRTAQVQVADWSPDARARDLGLAAVLQVNADHVRVLPAGGRWPAGQSLQLRFAHPTDGAADRQLTLASDASGWMQQTRIDTGHAWEVQLQPEDGSWRLVGRLLPRERAVHLGPALSSSE